VVLSADTASAAKETASKTGATAAATNAEAVQGADLVVLAVPHGAVAAIVTELGEALTGKTVVDATNPLTDDYSGLTTTGVSAAEHLQRRFPAQRSSRRSTRSSLAGTATRPKAVSRWTPSSPPTTTWPRRPSAPWPSRSATG
jgi:hypothetical protein